MKKQMIVFFTLLIGMLPTQSMAEEGKFNIGLGSKSVFIAIDDGLSINTFTWGGYALNGGYDFTDYITLNASTYKLTELVDANSKMTGFDMDVRFGPNSSGFTYYAALGYFSDTWNGSTSGVSQDYKGGSFGVGIGYNFDVMNLNWNILSIRSASDYQGTSTATFSVGSGSLSLSYRF